MNCGELIDQNERRRKKDSFELWRWMKALRISWTSKETNREFWRESKANAVA